MNDIVKALDVMEESVVSLRPEMSLKEASKLLGENKISGAPVVDSNGQLQGVFSQTDLIRRAVSDDFSHFPEDTYYIGMPYWETPELETVFEKLEHLKVEESMSTDVITCSPVDSVSSLAATMRRNKIHRIVVVDDSRVVGVVTSLGLLKVVESD